MRQAQRPAWMTLTTDQKERIRAKFWPLINRSLRMRSRMPDQSSNPARCVDGILVNRSRPIAQSCMM